MNIGSIGTQSGVNGASSLDNKRANLQMSLLKKMLEAQKEQAAEVQRVAEGKGNLLDIRV